MAAPAADTRTLRLSRSKICTPSCRSARATCMLSDGWETLQASAARRKPRRSATATMYCSWRSETSRGVIDGVYHREIIDIFDRTCRAADNRALLEVLT